MERTARERLGARGGCIDANAFGVFVIANDAIALQASTVNNDDDGDDSVIGVCVCRKDIIKS